MCAMCDRENSSHTGLRTFLAAVVITVLVSVAHSSTDRAEIANAAELQLADSTDLFAAPEDVAPAAGNPAANAAATDDGATVPADQPGTAAVTSSDDEFYVPEEPLVANQAAADPQGAGLAVSSSAVPAPGQGTRDTDKMGGAVYDLRLPGMLPIAVAATPPPAASMLGPTAAPLPSAPAAPSPPTVASASTDVPAPPDAPAKKKADASKGPGKGKGPGPGKDKDKDKGKKAGKDKDKGKGKGPAGT
jgi:hypothetical protein